MSNVISLRDRKPYVRAEVPHEADVLSFMRRRKPKGTGIDYWVVESTGNLSADYEKGRELGYEYLSYIGHYPTVGTATLLGCIVSSMIKQNAGSNRVGGIGMGFLEVINKYAMAMAAGVKVQS